MTGAAACWILERPGRRVPNAGNADGSARSGKAPLDFRTRADRQARQDVFFDVPFRRMAKRDMGHRERLGVGVVGMMGSFDSGERGA